MSALAADGACALCRGESETVLWRDPRLRVLAVDDPAYPGFLRVVWHAHVREMSDLEPADRTHLMGTVFTVERALRLCLLPDKINLASLGNAVPHLHWHVIARFVDDAHFPQPIWTAPQRATDAAKCAVQRARLAALPELIAQLVAGA